MTQFLKAQWSALMSSVSLQPKPLSEPELLCKSRPMTGVLGSLSAEQRDRVLNYDGPQDFGDEEFRRAR